MRITGIVVLLALTSGCVTTRIVNLDTGQGTPIVYKPVDVEPIKVSEGEFKDAVARFVLDTNLDVMSPDAPWAKKRSLLTFVKEEGHIDGVCGHTVLFSPHQQQSASHGRHGVLVDGLEMGDMDRRLTALSFAFDTAWDGVVDVVGSLTDPAALRELVVSLVGSALIMLVAPEPITKLLAIGLTACLIAYLGTGPVWSIGQGFLRLVTEAQTARNFRGLEEAGHRFGKVLGGNGARILIIVALTALGGKTAMASRGPRMPGFAQAALRSQSEGGFQLMGALTGEVRSLSLSSSAVLNIALAPTAVAAVAMGPGVSIQDDPEGSIHHICTDKNEISEAAGGPWTPIFEPYFEQAGMKLSDTENLVRIKGHAGPHPRAYHQEVLRRIDEAMAGCRGVGPCRNALVEALADIARDLTRAGSKLRKLVTQSPR